MSNTFHTKETIMTKLRISFHIDENDLKEIDRLTEKLELKNRSELLRKLLKMGLEDALILDKSGVLSLVIAAGKLRQKLKLSFLSGDESKITLDQLKP